MQRRMVILSFSRTHDCFCVFRSINQKKNIIENVLPIKTPSQIHTNILLKNTNEEIERNEKKHLAKKCQATWKEAEQSGWKKQHYVHCY